MAAEVTRVVHRCEQAVQDGKLDLSSCLLTSFPDAVFHLMRHTTVVSCDLSHNVLKKLPAKFATKFVHLQVLDLSANKFKSLPEGVSQLSDLHTLNASSNCLSVFPAVIVSALPKLKVLDLQNNRIAEVDRQSLDAAASNSLSELNLEGNPLTNNTRTLLSEVSEITIKTSDALDNYDCLD